MKICRKCSAENPDTNQYCKNCGAVLEVSTKMVMAQPKTIIPPIKRIKKRWIIYGMLIMFGSIAVATLLSSFIIFMIFNASDKNITELWYNNPGLPVFIVAIYLILFFAGGLIITVNKICHRCRTCHCSCSGNYLYWRCSRFNKR